MKQGELNVFLINKYPVKVYFNAKVMMYEFVLVTKQTIYYSGCGIFWICWKCNGHDEVYEVLSFFFYHSCAIYKGALATILTQKIYVLEIGK
jgi:hypothetical protein